MRSALLASAFLLVCSVFSQSDALPRKGMFGAQLLVLTDEMKSTAGVDAGVLIGSITPNTTASVGGLNQGDIVYSIDGRDVESPQEAVAAISGIQVGSRFEVKLVRNQERRSLSLTMLEKPRDKGANYEVIYDHVVSNGRRIRTMISKPAKPGKHPVFFLIQGLGNFSLDNPIGTGAYADILKPFVDEGWVTVRVDKPGQGDSEGGPTADEDFDAELDCYRQALKAIKKYDFVDPDRIFIFGHSMGGCFGPIVASEEKVAGIAVYGTVLKTWTEYWLENVRRQQLLGGASYVQVHDNLQNISRFMHYLLKERLNAEEIKLRYPDLQSTVNQNVPDGKHMSTRTVEFWRQLDSKNFASYWERVDAHVLTMWGENEFISTREDHGMIAEIVNGKRPGTAEFVIVRESDHGFYKTTSAADSHRKWGQPGSEFNPEVVRLLREWFNKVSQ
jgi:pimeloyl-ACP methyl ester carboxylesterase